MTRQTIDSVQGLRAIAALLVVVAHSMLTLVEKAGYDPSVTLLADAFGNAGVKIFFLISGFIMTITMHGQFAARNAPSSFLWKRLIRVVPLYWLATLVYALKLIVEGQAPDSGHLATSLFFIPYYDGKFYPVYGLGWTLNYEIFFYGLFAFALLLRLRLAIPLLVGLLIVLPYMGYMGLTDSCEIWLCDAFRFYARSIILYFAGGIALALLRIFCEKSNRLPVIELPVAISIAVALIAAYAVYYSAHNESPMRLFVEYPLCFAATAVCALAKDLENGGWFRNITLGLGNASYSIYLTHSFIIGPAGRIWSAVVGANALLLFIVLMVIGSSLLGLLSYKYLETPTLQALRSLRRNRSVPA